MYKYLLLGLFASLLVVNASFLEDAKKSHYAVLVAGSNGYWNYRHQADIFHAYHVLRNNGMPAENIIVFAYDDIANNHQNPFPGKVFNKPSQGPGQDYYEGVHIDYKGADVNPEVFLAVITGDAEKVKGRGSGKVLTSGLNDNVFMNFSDHGATGLIAFPSGELYADQLNNAFKTMFEKKMYNQLVFYLEACESGSMFNNILPENIRVYASSAANPYESSWGCYCGAEAMVEGKNIQSCLGDLYSVVWMEDSDLQAQSETIKDQFKVILEKTNMSHPMEWGDKTFEDKEAITDFQGNTDSTEDSYNYFTKLMNMFNIHKKKDMNKIREEQRYLDLVKKSSVVNSRDIKLQYLYARAREENTMEIQDLIAQEETLMQVNDTLFRQFAFDLELNVLNEKNENIQFECLRNSVNFYKETCGYFGEYTLKYVQYISIACKKYTEEKIRNTISDLC